MATVTQLEVREVTPGKGQLQEGTLFKEVYGREEGEGGRGREREREREREEREDINNVVLGKGLM